MPADPKISYFRYHLKFPVSARSAYWKSPLPLLPKGYAREFHIQTVEAISYGEYFQGVRQFLAKDHYERLTAAISQQIDRNINPEGIKNIRVCIEKHGAFYHPARIDVSGNDFAATFVLNVAISQAGKDGIEEEYCALEKLNPILPQTVVPKVYARGEIYVRPDQKIGMFLGEWFEGYHEFHLSRDPQNDTLVIRVWDPKQGGIYLDREQSRELYRQISWILTAGYNLQTTEQIFLWHLASGDFIVKLTAETMDVKLITVRRYTSRINAMESDAKALLHALLVFFLNLSLRIRLDRIDGDGEMVWSDDTAVEGAVLGFLEGLAQKPEIDILPGPTDVCFIAYLSNCSDSDLLDILRALVNAYPPHMPEVGLIRQHLPAHAVALRQVIQDFFIDKARY